jgi:hypothetical protein
MIGQNGTTFVAGATGGSADAVLPSHTHTFTGSALPGHQHTINYGTALFGGGGSPGIQIMPRPDQINTNSVSGGTPAGTNSTEGVSATNANLPPYIVVYMWQRTA